MRILILGSTGASGILLAREALDSLQSCNLVLYARSPGKLPPDLASNPSVIVMEGELENQDALTKALEGVDAVLSVLGPLVSLKGGPFHPSNTPLARAYERILALMHTLGVKRLIALGTASITDPNDKFSIKYSAMVAAVKAGAYNSYKEMVAIGSTIRAAEADIEWTIVRVPILTNRESKQVTAGYIGDGKTGTTLARAGFAAFMVKELNDSTWLKKAPLITS